MSNLSNLSNQITETIDEIKHLISMFKKSVQSRDKHPKNFSLCRRHLFEFKSMIEDLEKMWQNGVSIQCMLDKLLRICSEEFFHHIIGMDTPITIERDRKRLSCEILEVRFKVLGI